MEVRTHTALHVLKGAVVKVLGPGARWTASTHVDSSHGRLTVKFDRKPSPEEIRRIEEEANRVIREDLPVEVVVLPRRAAEEKYGDLIYDLFPVPDHVTEPSTAIIRDRSGELWNINACSKQHTASTGCIGRIQVGKPRFRRSKQLLEIPFDIEPNG